MNVEKFCVFCGNKPEKKNREHILPRWLIQLTNSQKKKVYLGYKISEDHSPREYSLDSFTFPACKSCNEQFGELEGVVKEIFKRILDSDPLSANDFSILLDWFDKVRIGLWLAYFYLDKNPGGITPGFFIKSRLGQHDRMLFIIKIDDNTKNLVYRGANFPFFYYTPSCFSLDVNNYSFLNISYQFLFSEQIGFPYPRESLLVENDERTLFSLVDGTQKIQLPLIEPLFRFQGTQIYQPMYKSIINNPTFSNLYNNDYVGSNSLDTENGVGSVWIQKGSQINVYPKNESNKWVPEKVYKRYSVHPDISIMTLQFQNYIDTLQPSMALLTEEHRKWWEEMIRTNKQYNDKAIRELEKNRNPAAIKKFYAS